MKEQQDKKLGKQVGEVFNYFKNVKVAAVKVLASVKVGDKVRFVGGETDFETEIKSMQVHNEKVEKAKKGDEIGILVSETVHKGYKVYKA